MGDISSRFSSNSEANASDLLENHEDMFFNTTYTVMSLACFSHTLVREYQDHTHMTGQRNITCPKKG